MRFLPILMYHSIDDSGSVVSISPELFAAQVRWLAQHGWRSMALRHACEHRKSHGDWPSNAVVMTFDDAYESVSSVSVPLLQAHRFSATIFVVTEHVGVCNDWAPPPARLGKQRIMDWTQLEQAHQAGIEIAAHTRTHPSLLELSAEQVDDELRSAQAVIEQNIGQTIVSFAHPYGYYNHTVKEMARAYYANVCTTSLARAGNQPDYDLPRVDMYYIRTLAAFKRLVMGKLDVYLSIRRWGRSLKKVFSSNDHANAK